MNRVFVVFISYLRTAHLRKSPSRRGEFRKTKRRIWRWTSFFWLLQAQSTCMESKTLKQFTTLVVKIGFR